MLSGKYFYKHLEQAVNETFTNIVTEILFRNVIYKSEGGHFMV